MSAKKKAKYLDKSKGESSKSVQKLDKEQSAPWKLLPLFSYNGGNGAVTEGREGGFPERIHIIGSNSGGTPPTYRFPSYA